MHTRRAVIVTGPGFQDHDVIYVYYRLIEEGYDVAIATSHGEAVTGKYGVPLPLDKLAKPTIPFSSLLEQDYDVVICTGGHEAPDRVRQDQTALDFVRAMAATGKIVAGLCHGPWIMISSQILAGKKVCAYVGMKDDMTNAGAIVMDRDVVVDGNIITCRYYHWVGAFMQTIFREIERQLPL